MIVHVAEAGEARGRVVLQLGSGEVSTLALEAAVRVAQAFNSEIESLFVESQQLLQLASYPFAREISRTGRTSRPISAADIEQDLRLESLAVQRKLDALARAADVPLRQRVVRATEPVEALAQACAECGPWNVVALGHAFGPSAAPALAALLTTVTDATGVIVVGPKAQRSRGPIILAVEDTDRLPSMLAAAERLAATCSIIEGPGEIIVLLIGADTEQIRLLESHVRLSLGGREHVRLQSLDIGHGATAVLAERLRRLAGGFVIAAFGGLAVPEEGDLAPLAVGLECPLFLVR